MRNPSIVANPLLRLPAARRLAELPLDSRLALVEVLAELSTDAARLADESWRRRKAPMAAYWKAVAVYARHTARALVTPDERRRGRIVRRIELVDAIAEEAAS